jgi:adenylate cyclase
VSEEGVERRLAAILAADVVGYTRLMGADEAGTLRRLTELRQEVLEPLITEHDGRIVKLIGDGLLVEFTSVVSTVACAMAWQRNVAKDQVDRDAGSRLQFRIGINLGDVIVEGDDIHGDGVNIAARLEGLAEPGGICLSGDAFRQAKGKIEAEFEDMGEQDLKNVAEPVRVYRIAGDRSGVGAASPAKEPLKLPDKPSVAVLPFENLSGDPEQEYFADGMTRDLITEIGRFLTLQVIAATTMFAYKKRRVSVTDIRRDLNVRYVLEGSIRKGGRRIRVTAQLTDAETGNQIWGDHFDGDLGDIFEIQDAITRLISSNLYQPLMDYGSLKARQQPATSADAYDLYLRAMYYIDHPTREGIKEARQACQRALEIDPNFALVYELLMWTHLHDAWNGWAEDPEPKLRMARQEAAHGVTLEPKNAYLRGSLGFIEVFLGNEDSGLKELQAAVNLLPSDPIYHVLYGGALSFTGHTEEALRVLEEAERLGPGYHVTRLFEGDAHFVAGRTKEAVSCYEQLLMVLPHFSWALLYLTACHVELGQLEAAQQDVAKILAESPSMTQGYVKKLLHARELELVDRILRSLRAAGLPE